MTLFVNRKNEMNFLNQAYKRPGSSLIVLYGRRRVGKTHLAAEFMKDKPAIYYLATEESELQNMGSFKDLVAEFTGNELLKYAKVEQWELLFKALSDVTKSEKLVIILDEFQYLGKSTPAFPSVFQKIWDMTLKDKNVMVILCGSLISMMESQTLSYSSPLYGRRTGQIKLKQIPFSYYHEFFPKMKRRELVQYYAVTGGVPKYIELVGGEEDVFRAIQSRLLNKSSFLYDEPYFLLQNEVSEVGSYFSVIKAIAAGNRKLSKIAAQLELKQTGLTKYLKTLIDLDLLEREVPVTEENPEKSKKGQYKIKDNYIHFWFKFIYPNRSFIESGNCALAMQKIESNFIDQHVGYVYEDVCIEEMWRLNADRQWPFTFDRVGRWWNNNCEIDLVAYESGGHEIIFGECKFWEGLVGLNVLKELEIKAESVEWKKDQRKAYYVLFSISGFTKELIAEAESRDDLLLCK